MKTKKDAMIDAAALTITILLVAFIIAAIWIDSPTLKVLATVGCCFIARGAISKCFEEDE